MVYKDKKSEPTQRSYKNPVINARTMYSKFISTSFIDQMSNANLIINDNDIYKLKTLNNTENLPLKIFLKGFEFIFEVMMFALKNKAMTQFRRNFEF